MDEFVALDFSKLKPAPCWTKRKLVDFLEKSCKQELLRIHTRYVAMDRAITIFQNSTTAKISSIPSQILDKPYFGYHKLLGKNMRSSYIGDIKSEVKKRARMEWEDGVRTFTGKRPCHSKSYAVDGSDPMITINESDIYHKSILPNKGQDVSDVQVVASTPNDQKQFLSPFPASRITRSRANQNQQAPGPRSRLGTMKNPMPLVKRSSMARSELPVQKKPRLFHTHDKLLTASGTPIKNPFSLLCVDKSTTVSTVEVRVLRELATTIQTFLSKKGK